jgi:SAM-dependent methyltransferase
MAGMTYYRECLALVHHLGFAAHAESCAPGVLALLEPVRARGGLVLELGCGSGLLTRRLVEAGHRVIATDASPAMLKLAQETAPGADLRRLVLPHNELPAVDAVVSVGHVLNYLADEADLEAALVAIAGALRAGGIVALDLCDLEWGRVRAQQPDLARVTDDWAIVTRFSTPSPTRYVREMTVFVRGQDGSWQRDDERHDNVLYDTARVPAFLSAYGVEAEVRPSFGDEDLPNGLVAIVGRR